MATDFEEKWDDIQNNYIKKKPSWLTGFKGRSKDDLRFWLENELGPGQRGGRSRISRSFAIGLTNTRGAGGLLLEQEAVKLELQRPIQQRRVDEAITAKDTRKITKQTLRLWRRNPGRFDLSGIDTRTKTLLSKEISRKINEKQSAGFTITRRNGIPSYQDKNKRFRNVLNGQFVR